MRNMGVKSYTCGQAPSVFISERNGICLYIKKNATAIIRKLTNRMVILIKILTHKDIQLVSLNVLQSLFLLLTKILKAVKKKLREQCVTMYSRSGFNLIWILKIFTKVLENLKSYHFTEISSIWCFCLSVISIRKVMPFV